MRTFGPCCALLPLCDPLGPRRNPDHPSSTTRCNIVRTAWGHDTRAAATQIARIERLADTPRTALRWVMKFNLVPGISHAPGHEPPRWKDACRPSRARGLPPSQSAVSISYLPRNMVLAHSGCIRVAAISCGLLAKKSLVPISEILTLSSGVRIPFVDRLVRRFCLAL